MRLSFEHDCRYTTIVLASIVAIIFTLLAVSILFFVLGVCFWFAAFEVFDYPDRALHIAFGPTKNDGAEFRDNLDLGVSDSTFLFDSLIALVFLGVRFGGFAFFVSRFPCFWPGLGAWRSGQARAT